MIRRAGWWEVGTSEDVLRLDVPGGRVYAVRDGIRSWLWNITVHADDGTVLDRFGITMLDRAEQWAATLTAQHAIARAAGTVKTDTVKHIDQQEVAA